MRNRLVTLGIMAFTWLLAGNLPAAETKPTLVFLLAGQSNMEGVGANAELPAEYRDMPAHVRLYSHGHWLGLQTGFGADTNHFGPEIGIARVLAAKYPDRNLAFIKSAAGGTSLGKSWNVAGGPLYKHCLDNAQTALKSLRDGGETGQVAGLFWMQGEADSRVEAFATNYAAAFPALITGFRTRLAAPAAPFVFGRVSISLKNHLAERFPYVDAVRQAQAQTADPAHGIILCDTDDLPTNPDHLHFNAAGQLELGRRMGEAMVAKLTVP